MSSCAAVGPKAVNALTMKLDVLQGVDDAERWGDQRAPFGLSTRMRPVLIYTTDFAMFVA